MTDRDIVVIAASRGGFQVLRNLVAQLPGDLPAAILVVLHIGRHDSVLPDLLTGWGPLRARYAKHGDTVTQGTILAAPPDRHLTLGQGRAWLNDGAKENFARPAADPLFRSAAVEYGSRVVGVVLSGDLDDGAAGLAAIHAAVGVAIVQDPEDCEAPGMPSAALESTDVDIICKVRELAHCIGSAVRGTSARSAGKPRQGAGMGKEVLQREARVAAKGLSSVEELDDIGVRSPLTCPDCGGTLWRIRDDRPLRYRCHTGHAFTGLSLEEGYASCAEEAIWSAIRAVHERVIFARERQQWAERSGNAEQVNMEQARIDEAERLAELLRQAMQVYPTTAT
jgi:two-component system, chemotaxis family, protein-glutamate methylesterase/glutaminase